MAAELVFFCIYLTDLYVFGSIISQPLIHLVTDTQHVMLDAQISDHLELFSLVNLPFQRMFELLFYTLDNNLTF